MVFTVSAESKRKTAGSVPQKIEKQIKLKVKDGSKRTRLDIKCILNCQKTMVDTGFIVLQAICLQCENPTRQGTFQWKIAIDGKNDEIFNTQYVSVKTDDVLTQCVWSVTVEHNGNSMEALLTKTKIASTISISPNDVKKVDFHAGSGCHLFSYFKFDLSASALQVATTDPPLIWAVYVKEVDTGDYVPIYKQFWRQYITTDDSIVSIVNKANTDDIELWMMTSYAKIVKQEYNNLNNLISNHQPITINQVEKCSSVTSPGTYMMYAVTKLASKLYGAADSEDRRSISRIVEKMMTGACDKMRTYTESHHVSLLLRYATLAVDGVDVLSFVHSLVECFREVQSFQEEVTTDLFMNVITRAKAQILTVLATMKLVGFPDYKSKTGLLPLLWQSGRYLLQRWPSQDVRIDTEFADTSLTLFWTELHEGKEEILIAFPTQGYHISQIVIVTNELIKILPKSDNSDLRFNVMVYTSNTVADKQQSPVSTDVSYTDSLLTTAVVDVSRKEPSERRKSHTFTGAPHTILLEASFHQNLQHAKRYSMVMNITKEDGQSESTCFIFKIRAQRPRKRKILMTISPNCNDCLVGYRYRLVKSSSDTLTIFDEEIQFQQTPGGAAVNHVFDPLTKSQAKQGYSHYAVMIHLTKTTPTFPSVIHSGFITLSFLQCPMYDDTTKTWTDAYSEGFLLRNGQLKCQYSRLLQFSSGFAPVSEYDVATIGMGGEGIHGIIADPAILVTVVTVTILLLGYIPYAVGMDKEEMHFDMTHVTRSQYRSDAIHQYLVCIVTGLWPGSATSSDACISLIGEEDMTSPYLLKAQPRFERGSELWYLIGTDQDLGGLRGLVLTIFPRDKNSNWFCKKVMMYSRYTDQITTFRASAWLHKRISSVLVPIHDEMYQINRRWSYIKGRFARWSRNYNCLYAILFPIPGHAYTRLQTGVRLYVVIVSCLLLCLTRIEVLQNQSKRQGGESWLADAFFGSLLVGLYSFLISLAMSLLFGLVQPRKHKILWPNQPRGDDVTYNGRADEDQDRYSSSSLWSRLERRVPLYSFSVFDSVADEIDTSSVDSNENCIKPEDIGKETKTKYKHKPKTEFWIEEENMTSSDNKQESRNKQRQGMDTHYDESNNRSTSSRTQSRIQVDSQRDISFNIVNNLSRSSSAESTSSKPRKNLNIQKKQISTEKLSRKSDLSRFGRYSFASRNYSRSTGSSSTEDNFTFEEFQYEKDCERTLNIVYLCSSSLLWTLIIVYCCWATYFIVRYSIDVNENQTSKWLFMFVSSMLFDVCFLETSMSLAAAVIYTMAVPTLSHLEEQARDRWVEVLRDVRSYSWYVRTDIMPRYSVPQAPRVSHAARRLYILISHVHRKLIRLSTDANKLTAAAPQIFKKGGIHLIIFIITCFMLAYIDNEVTNQYRQDHYVKGIFNLNDNLDPLQKPMGVNDFWDYMEEPFLTTWAKLTCSGTRPDWYPGEIVVLGAVHVRQVRFEPVKNVINTPLRKHYRIYEYRRKDVRTFKGTWQQPYAKGEEEKAIRLDPTSPYVYTKSNKGSRLTNGIKLPAGGYIFLLNGTNDAETLAEMKASDWLDKNTVFISVEFSLYNIDSKMVTSVNILFRSLAGAFHSSNRVLSYPMKGFNEKGILFEIIFVLFCFQIVFNVTREIFGLRNGISYVMKSPGTYIEIFRMTICACLVYEEIEMIYIKLEKLHKHNCTNDADTVYDIGYHDDVLFMWFGMSLSHLYGLLLFVDIMQILFKSRDFPQLGLLFRMLVSTINLGMDPLLMYTAYTCLGNLGFGPKLHTWSTFKLSIMTVVGNTVRGIFAGAWQESLEAERIFSYFFYVSYFIMMNLMIINFFIIYMNEAYSSLAQMQRHEKKPDTRGFIAWLFSHETKWDVDEEGNSKLACDEEQERLLKDMEWLVRYQSKRKKTVNQRSNK